MKFPGNGEEKERRDDEIKGFLFLSFFCRGGRRKEKKRKKTFSISPVASRLVFHPNQLIPFMTTSFPVWSTMRPFLVVSKGVFEEAAAAKEE